MYALRRINNMYSEHAGSRSDFIIMGHPEYCLGKQRCQKLDNSWDQSRAAGPARTLSAPSRAICTRGLYLRPLKERALERSCPAPKETPPSLSHLDGFLTALSSDTGHPQPLATTLASLSGSVPISSPSSATKQFHHRIVQSASDTSIGCLNTVAARHYKDLRNGLDDIKKSFEKDPVKTRKQLASSGAWRYYAPLLEENTTGQLPPGSLGGSGSLRRSQAKWLAHHNVPCGIRPRSHSEFGDA